MLARSASRAGEAGRRSSSPSASWASRRARSRAYSNPPAPLTAIMTSAICPSLGSGASSSRVTARRSASPMLGSAAMSGKGDLVLAQVRAEWLARDRGILGVVEQIVHDLKSHPQSLAEPPESGSLFASGPKRPDLAGARDQRGRFCPDQEVVLLLRRTPAAREPGAAASHRRSSRWSPGSAPAGAPGRPAAPARSRLASTDSRP